MDALYQTPLLDLFRRGEVAPDIRMLAAQGVLAPRAHEQLALLVWLLRDTDPAVRKAAEATIDRIPSAVLARFLSRSDVPADIAQFFAARGAVPAGASSDGDDRGPLVSDGTGGDAFDEDAGAAVPGVGVGGASDGDESDSEGSEFGAAARGRVGRDEPAVSMSTARRISQMSMMDKVKTAMRGNREERMLLIRDSHKLVSIAVLASPRLTEQEVEGYAKMASVSEDVLRVIGSSRAWTKDYSIVRALTFNPKTPIAISMGFVSRLLDKDVKGLASDRNIAEPIKLLARKMMQASQSRKR